MQDCSHLTIILCSSVIKIALTEIAKKHPQTAHAAITKSLQHEWTLLKKF
jgi:hypothetical protein